FPLFNAIIGPLETRSLIGLAKGVVVLGVIAAILWMGFFAWSRRDWLSLTTGLPLMLFATTVNVHEAFIVVRYSCFLVIPFCSWAAVDSNRRALFASRWFIRMTALVLVVSQWAWAAYTVKYFWNYYWSS